MKISIIFLISILSLLSSPVYALLTPKYFSRCLHNPKQYCNQVSPPKCYAQSILQDDINIPKVASSKISPMREAIAFLHTIWQFSRPHTLVGSGISIISIFAFATPVNLWGTYIFWKSLLAAMIPSLCMNIYITGLNQVTDVDIDKINKPYLPIAAGKLSYNHGIVIIISSLIIALLSLKFAGWPLQLTVLGSMLLGTVYSMPPFRLKRFPLLAAFCILTVRGSLVNMGFFFQAKQEVMGIQIPRLIDGLNNFPESIILSSFFAIFGIVIAMMKDVPDIEGDRTFNIKSFSVSLGASKMFKYSCGLLNALLSSTTVASIIATCLSVNKLFLSPSKHEILTTVGRSIISGLLSYIIIDTNKKASKINVNDSKDIFEFYMYTWKIFYLFYIILPFVR